MYRTIDTAFWNDPKIRRLDRDAKLLFLYCCTNDHAHVSGIYYLRPSTMAEEVGLSAKAVAKSLKDLCPNLVQYDYTVNVIWVRNMLKRQGYRPSPTIIKRIVSHLPSLYESKLILAFLEHYQHLGIEYRYPIDKVFSTFQNSPKEQDQEQELEQDQEQDQDSDPDTPSATLRVLPVPDNSKSAQLEKIKADFGNLAEKFPHLHIQEEFERWNDWMDAKGKTFKSYPAAFRNWCNADWKKPTGTPKPPHKPSLAERLAQRDK